MDLFGATHQADGVNFAGCRQRSNRHRHRILSTFAVDDVLEYERLALALIQAAELPAHERHQFRALVDGAFNAHQLAAFLQHC